MEELPLTSDQLVLIVYICVYTSPIHIMVYIHLDSTHNQTVVAEVCCCLIHPSERITRSGTYICTL